MIVTVSRFWFSTFCRQTIASVIDYSLCCMGLLLLRICMSVLLCVTVSHNMCFSQYALGMWIKLCFQRLESIVLSCVMFLWNELQNWSFAYIEYLCLLVVTVGLTSQGSVGKNVFLGPDLTTTLLLSAIYVSSRPDTTAPLYSLRPVCLSWIIPLGPRTSICRFFLCIFI